MTIDSCVRFLRYGLAVALLLAPITAGPTAAQTELVATTAKWTQMPEDVIRQIPGQASEGRR